MAEQTVVDRIRSLELFSCCPDAMLEKIADRAELVQIDQDHRLIRCGERGDSLFVVQSGRLEARLPNQVDGQVARTRTLGPGAIVGEIQFVTGGNRTADVDALESSVLLKIPSDVLLWIESEHSELLEQINSFVLNRLRHDQLASALENLFGNVSDPLFSEVTESGEWIRLAAGELLFCQGEPAENWYVLTSGRLQVSKLSNGVEEVINDIHAGETFGEIALLIGGQRTATVRATRDCELIRFTRAAFDEFSARHPEFSNQVTKVLVKRLLQRENAAAKGAKPKILVVVRAPGIDDAREVIHQLGAALETLGSTALLNQNVFTAHMGYERLDNHSHHQLVWTRLATWLNSAEARHDFVLVDAGTVSGEFAQQCIVRADTCVYLADADAGTKPEFPQTGSSDADNRDGGFSAPWTLLLVHQRNKQLPSETAKWLNGFPFTNHLHLRTYHEPDFGRVARMLARRGVGVALGGGGARGFAHIGVLRALVEYGIPIDLIGGTSVGSFFGGAFAMGMSTDQLHEHGRRFIRQKPFQEFTIPMVSLIKGNRFMKAIEQIYGDAQIEDAWITFFSVSSNLTTGQPVIDKRGALRKGIRASASLPGILPPVKRGKHLLVDGGMLNNLPADVVLQNAGGPTIAVSASPKNEMQMDLAEIPSNASVFWNRILPLRQSVDVPSLARIFMRANHLPGIKQAATIREMVDLMLEPPLGEFGLLEFESTDRMIEIGYEYAIAVLQAKAELGKLDCFTRAVTQT